MVWLRGCWRAPNATQGGGTVDHPAELPAPDHHAFARGESMWDDICVRVCYCRQATLPPVAEGPGCLTGSSWAPRSRCTGPAAQRHCLHAQQRLLLASGDALCPLCIWDTLHTGHSPAGGGRQQKSAWAASAAALNCDRKVLLLWCVTMCCTLCCAALRGCNASALRHTATFGPVTPLELRVGSAKQPWCTLPPAAAECWAFRGPCKA